MKKWKKLRIWIIKKYKSLEKAVEITEKLDEYIVPNTSIYWAINELRNFAKEKIENDNS